MRLPVCDGERFVGVVNLADVSHALAAGEGDREVRSILVPADGVLSPGDTLERAASLMAEPCTPLLPVLAGGGKLVGVVTRRDLLSAYRSVISQ